MNDSIKELTKKVVEFRDARNWKQFHRPKDMAISISLEAAELLEVFQWSGADTEVDTDKKLSKVKEELADILMYALLMGNDLGLDIPEIINDKLAENNRKYPAEKAYGKADKYTAYVTDGGEGK
ncbi:MAG: nucleotide pyrophosphohydrolase [Butyrivibrio sp.]|nr:nucleotide pyrophosphohydrolase [Butyrivibrio sp.]